MTQKIQHENNHGSTVIKNFLSFPKVFALLQGCHFISYVCQVQFITSLGAHK